MYQKQEIPAAYQAKLKSATEAASLVKSGDRVHFGMGIGSSYDFDEALAKRADELEDVKIITTIALRKAPLATYLAGREKGSFKFHSSHFSGLDRKMSKDGHCWYIPINFDEMPRYWAEDGNGFDVAVLQVCPMDANGYFNMGPQCADNWAVLAHAKKIVVEVNENMPFAHGFDNFIPLDQVDCIIEGSNPALTELPSGEVTDIDRKIASYVVDKVVSGSVLQLGIGALPAAIGTLLADSDVKDLSCHTEMFVDSYLHLFNAGKLTNKKPIYNGKMVYTFAGGSKELYDFVDNNPLCLAAPVDYVNDPAVIAQLDNFVSVNGCINLDLYGQVCSEMADFQHISGTGGQLNFVLGAYHAKGGQSFICTKSTRKGADGQLESLIIPAMPAGSIVTTPRHCTHYIVTEYGAANLKGKSTWERAELLIGIAHPDFREQLIADAEKQGIWTKTSKLGF